VENNKYTAETFRLLHTHTHTHTHTRTISLSSGPVHHFAWTKS